MEKPRDGMIEAGRYAIGEFEVIKTAALVPGSSFRGWRIYRGKITNTNTNFHEVPTLKKARAWCEANAL